MKGKLRKKAKTIGINIAKLNKAKENVINGGKVKEH